MASVLLFTEKALQLAFHCTADLVLTAYSTYDKYHESSSSIGYFQKSAQLIIFDSVSRKNVFFTDQQQSGLELFPKLNGIPDNCNSKL